ncbi:unnamed protein product [Durusdinium trenchii]|uniref:Uncharacterized protein n=1 Tax=Durusdinium trenchii TaxID=1381693 RepID=A0ABP0SX55_9DINO
MIESTKPTSPSEEGIDVVKADAVDAEFPASLTSPSSLPDAGKSAEAPESGAENIKEPSEVSDLEDFVEERMRRSTELLALFSQEQEWLDQAADIMAARRVLAKEEAAAISLLEEEDAHHQEELDQLEAYVHQMSEHCESGGSSFKPDVSKCHALEEKMRRNNSMPSIATKARQTLTKSGSMPLQLPRELTSEASPKSTPRPKVRARVVSHTGSTPTTPSRARPQGPKDSTVTTSVTFTECPQL